MKKFILVILALIFSFVSINMTFAADVWTQKADAEGTLSAPGYQVKTQDYLRGEIIIKFKDEAIIGAVASELVQRRQGFNEITGNSHLDDLNARYKVKAMHKIFGKKGMPALTTGSIDISTARTLHRQQHEQFKAEVAASREKRFKRKGLQGNSITEEKNVPYLGSVYRVEVDPEADIEETCSNYALDPDVAYCQPNYRMEAQLIPDDPYYLTIGSWGQSYDDMWGLKKLQTAEAWDITAGAGVVVAVVDTGIDFTHPDIAANIWTNTDEIAGNGVDDDGNGFIDDTQGWNFVSSNNTPIDGHGHGTHCAGTIAAIGNNGIGVIGVAPSAKIMPVKGLDDSGSGYTSGLAAGIRYAANNGADVISNSWGCYTPCPSNPLAEDAVKYAHDLGAVVVFAAGNNGDKTTYTGDVTQYSPANQPNYVIAVAASSELDKRSSFSNIGSLIAVAAPGGGENGTSSNYSGINILSLRAGTTDMCGGGGICIVGNNYYRASGTSMAAPHVSGVAALILANHPEFTPDDVKQVLQISSDDIESTGFDLLSGAGRVNSQKALNIMSVPKVRITSPSGVVANGTITINGDAYGTNFVKYQLLYATIDKNQNYPYAPVLGSWQALGAESYQSVTNGVLGSFDSSLLETGRYYLIRLVVTTTDSLQFSDIKEITPTDATPDQFTFTAQTGVALNTVITSNTITVSGINEATPISITGGTYSINGGAYTSASGTVVNGNTVTVHLTSSSSYSTTTTATLTVGGVSGAFSVTTTASSGDTTPDQFTFTAQTGVELSMLITSNAITVSGINTAAPISILGGGAYSINGGSYTYSSGTVNNGDTVTVQLASSGQHSTTTSTTLTIGGVSGTFSVTTHQFHFASQAGMDLSTVTTSDTIAVSWINTATPISITGGTYSINGGAYTSASGTVVQGNTVTVRQISSASYSTTTDATLTIGEISAPFSVTTKSEFGDIWTSKADFGGGLRDAAVGFSIGNKGYIGTGSNGSVYYTKDFWEYDPATNTWTQKAAFGGAERNSAVGFSIGSKGYIGTGYGASNTYYKDFWEYDPALNTWTQKADFGGVGRDRAVGFSIGSKGYIGTGFNASSTKDFWEYDPTYNTWTRKTDFGGMGRYRAIGFAIGDKGYIGTGNGSSSPYYLNDFWEYDPATSLWTQKADFGGTGRGGAIGFSVGSRGYVGTGAEREAPCKKNDFWEYDPVINTWTKRADLRGAGRYYAVGFSIGSKGYIGTGWYNTPSSTYFKDFWEYEPSYTPTDTTPDQFTFTAQTGVPLNMVIISDTITVTGINVATPISITGGAYSINGGDFTSANGTVNNLDAVTVLLTSSENFSVTTTATLTIGGVSGTFSVTTEAVSPFTFTDQTNVPLNTLVTSNSITVSGTNTALPISITGGTYSINGGAYTSASGTVYNGDTVTMQQTSSASYQTMTFATLTIGDQFGTFSVTTISRDTTPDQFTFTAQTGMTPNTLVTSNVITVSGINSVTPISITGGVYSINGGTYTSASGTVNNGDSITVQLTSSGSYYATTYAILTIGGVSGTFSTTTQVAPPGLTTDTWTQKADFGGTARNAAAGFSIGNKAYIGTGFISIFVNKTKDFWEYDPATNIWTQKADFGGTARCDATGFPIGNKGYIGTGNDNTTSYLTSYTKDFWEYDPDLNTWTRKADFGGTARYRAVGFSVGSKGYIGTGASSSGSQRDFWEYDPSANTWTKKADFGGTARALSVGLSIGSKGYIGTGYANSETKDFWEYDPAGNTWTRKSDFGGLARHNATGFSIGSKGFIGTGSTPGTKLKDFWEYDPSVDTWVQKTDFDGTARYQAVGFSIGTKGYIGTGYAGTGTKDFWEYESIDRTPDQFIFNYETGVPLTTVITSNTITVSGINAATAISITGGTYSINGGANTGEPGSVVNGDTVTVQLISSANYSTTTNATLTIGSISGTFSVTTIHDTVPDNFTFSSQTNVALNTAITSNTITVSGIDSASPISIVGGLYSINGGSYTTANGTVNNDDTVTVQLTSSTNYSTTTSATLTIGGLSCTFSVTTAAIDRTPNQFTFTEQTGVSLNTAITSNASTLSGINAATPISIIGGTYSINGGAYTNANSTVNNGDTVTAQLTSSGSYSATAYAFLNIGGVYSTFRVTTQTAPSGEATDTWTQKADFGGVARDSSAYFSIGSKGYIGTGYYASASYKKDFWEYDPVANVWTQKADFGGTARYGAVGFSIGSKGYIGTGNDGSFRKDLWEYDPSTNTWKRKVDFGGTGREYAIGFSIGSKGYIGTGYYYDSSYNPHNCKDFWEYDPSTNAWTQKADFRGTERKGAVGFSTGSKGYIGTGVDGSSFKKDFWEYDPVANAWTQKADLGGAERAYAVGFSIGSKGYVGTGFNDSSYMKDFWEYNPATDTWMQKIDFGGTARIIAGGFSIGNKGYIGIGFYFESPNEYYYKDFWEYEPIDRIPDSFSFTAQTGVALNTLVNSNSITVSGINAVTPISVTGGSYSINGGAYTSETGTVANSDTVTVQLTSSTNYLTTSSATLIIGGVSGTFSVTTIHDTTPDNFAFTSQTSVALNTLVTSNSITVSGIDAATPISITGGTYSINGGAYTGETGSVVNGDTVTVQFASSGSYSTMTTTTLTIGGVSGTFNVTTIHDTTPDNFNFTSQTSVALNTLVTSNSITISGIDAATPISITGGTYSINGGTYTSETGTINHGDIITVQFTSSGSYSTTTNTTLTIGGVSGAFTVTTIHDTVPDNFNFIGQTGVALNTLATSNGITVSGIDAATPILITDGTYSINGGAYTSETGTINNGDTITVQLTSSGSYSTTTTATITIGGIIGIFNVTTIHDTTPDNFSFTAQTNVTLNTEITSNTITVQGIDVATPVLITGGSYSINGGAYTSQTGTINNSDTVTVKLISSGNYSTTTSATLTIGGVSSIFNVTTIHDTTPDNFSFTAQTNVALNTVVTSNTITVSGIDAATPIAITGGTYSINGGAFTSETGTINNGNTVTVQQTSSGSYSTTTKATLIIGGVSGTFNVTTIHDTTPDNFSFTAQTNVALNTVVTSNTITVSGIDAATPIAITGGTYSINGGAYTSASGTVNNGNTVTVRQTSSASYSTTTNATLTIGGVSDTFSVTTAAQDTIPDSFSFTDQTGVALNMAITSNTITVSGINASTAISITGGTYSINGGAYTSASGTVVNGNTVTVKLTSSGSYTTTTNATLTIGGVADTFSVTTGAKDTTPNSFSFTAQTGVALSTAITSNTITVSGINASTAISITGGTYSINGGSYRSTSSTVTNGNTVTVRLTSSSSHSTTKSAKLTIGGVSATFSVTTAAKDTTPDQFTFVDQTGVSLNTAITSNTITVSGINASTAISITGGTYSINGGSYRSTSSTVTNGNTVRVKLTSSTSANTTKSATLTIGGVSDTFSVTTRP